MNAQNGSLLEDLSQDELVALRGQVGSELELELIEAELEERDTQDDDDGELWFHVECQRCGHQWSAPAEVLEHSGCPVCGQGDR